MIKEVIGSRQDTPCYKKSILGSKWTISRINFFCRFLLRLSENNHSRVMFMAKFGPTASNFCYENFYDFWVEIRAFVRPHVWSWTGFDLLTISGIKFWWFFFFTSSPGPQEPELAPLEKSQEICIISEIALKVELAPIDFSLISYWFQKAKWSAHRKKLAMDMTRKLSDSLSLTKKRP